MTRIFRPRRFYRAPAYGSGNASITYRSKLPVELYLLSVRIDYPSFSLAYTKRLIQDWLLDNINTFWSKRCDIYETLLSIRLNISPRNGIDSLTCGLIRKVNIYHKPVSDWGCHRGDWNICFYLFRYSIRSEIYVFYLVQWYSEKMAFFFLVYRNYKKVCVKLTNATLVPFATLSLYSMYKFG